MFVNLTIKCVLIWQFSTPHPNRQEPGRLSSTLEIIPQDEDMPEVLNISFSYYKVCLKADIYIQTNQQTFVRMKNSSTHC